MAAFEFNAEMELLQLRAELLTRTYRPGPYHSFYVHDPKRRLISAAPFRDRVVHHALCRVLEPIWERRFICDTYANRAGKGVHAALDRAQHFARANRYVLQCDVRQFFPGVDHAILRAQLARRVADPGVLWLIDRVLESGADALGGEHEMIWFPGDDRAAALRPRGLPIGNLTSQFWANVYLNEFDHFVKRELGCRAYVRYVDDFLLFDARRRRLWDWRQAIRERLAGLRLMLHEGRAQARPVAEGFPFLGFRVFPTHRRLRARRGHAFRRRYRRLLRACARGQVSPREVTLRVQGWVAHAAHGQTYGLRRAVLGGQR